MKRLPILLLLLTACDDQVSQDEVEALCSPEFLLQYDIQDLDAQYAPTIEAAADYGIEGGGLDLDSEDGLCLDYKAQYEVDQQGYESLALQVEASANADAFGLGASRVDRSLRWVTFEGETAGPSEDIPIPPGWVTFIFLRKRSSGYWAPADLHDGYIHSDYVDMQGNVSYRISFAYSY